MRPPGAPWLALLLAVAALVCLSAVSGQEDCPPEDACRASPDYPVCSGRGYCRCGQCECRDQDISGSFCECDNFSCDRYQGRLCGGPDHGQCRCGVCSCFPGWTGAGCMCSTSNETCIQPGTERVCNNKGTCECGRCRCHQHQGERYAGNYCEQCPTCSDRCETYRNCVECLAFGKGPLADRCHQVCRRISITTVDELTVSSPEERLCRFLTDEDCAYQFVYGASEGASLRVQARPSCPPTQRRAPVVDWSRGGAGAAGGFVVPLLVALAAAVCGW